MPPRAPFLLSFLQFILLSILVAMALAWTWAIGRLINRQPLLPEAKPRIVPWGTGSVLLVFFEWAVVNVVISMGYAVLTRARPAKQALTLTDQVLLISLINLVLLITVPALLRLTLRSWSALRHLGIGREGLGRHLREGAVAFLLMTPIVYALQGAAALIWTPRKHPLEQMVLSQPSLNVALLAFVSAVVLAPAAEELIFRGIIQSWLTGLFLRSSVKRPAPEAGDYGLSDPFELIREAIDPEVKPEWTPPRTEPVPHGGPRPRQTQVLPIVLTSAFFALVHLPQWPAPIAIFLLSLGLGTVFQRTGSLVTSFTMHALFNGFSTLMLLYATLLGLTPGVKKPAPPAKKFAPIAACDARAGRFRDVFAGAGGSCVLRASENVHSDVFSVGAEVPD
ncbi:MAG: lysostaphin resistance A-like protein [Planctomycetaceae bacterium]